MVMARVFVIAIAMISLANGCGGDSRLGGLPGEGRALPVRYQVRIESATSSLNKLRVRVSELPHDQDGVDAATTELAGLSAHLASASSELAVWHRELDAAIATARRPIVARALEKFNAQVGGDMNAIEHGIPYLERRIENLEESAKALREAAAVVAAATFAATLPGNVNIRGDKEGFEESALTGFPNPSLPAGPARWPSGWLALDQVTFSGANGDRLDNSKSRGQLQNVSRLLAAFPELNLDVGGASEVTTNETSNTAARKVSRKRADQVVAALAAFGVSPQRMVVRRGPEREMCSRPPAPVDEACVTAARQMFVRLLGPR